MKVNGWKWWTEAEMCLLLGRVLIHCAAGIHQAPMCAAGVLSVLRKVPFGPAYKLVAAARYVEPWAFRKYAGASQMQRMHALLERRRLQGDLFMAALASSFRYHILRRSAM